MGPGWVLFWFMLTLLISRLEGPRGDGCKGSAPTAARISVVAGQQAVWTASGVPREVRGSTFSAQEPPIWDRVSEFL